MVSENQSLKSELSLMKYQVLAAASGGNIHGTSSHTRNDMSVHGIIPLNSSTPLIQNRTTRPNRQLNIQQSFSNRSIQNLEVMVLEGVIQVITLVWIIVQLEDLHQMLVLILGGLEERARFPYQ